MQMFPTLQTKDAVHAGWGVRVQLVSPTGPKGHIAQRLARMGGVVDLDADLHRALTLLARNPRAVQVVVVDADAYGGLAAAMRACVALCALMPVVLISADCQEQTITQRPGIPIVLRAPVSAVALGVAFDAVFRDRRVIGAL